MLNFNTDNLGEFQEYERGRWFTYRATSNPWALAHGLTHEVECLMVCGSPSFAKPALKCACLRVTQVNRCWSVGSSSVTAFTTDSSAHKLRPGACQMHCRIV